MTETAFRDAQEQDTGLLLQFIREIAAYEKMSDEVVATEELLHRWLFEEGLAHAFFILDGGQEVGFVLYFYNFSTFVGRAGLYLEDLYIRPAYRGRGHGRAALEKLARIALARGCGRMEWSCLDWNAPSIAFYRSLGARPMDEWTVYRLSGETLRSLGEGREQRG